MLQDASIKPLSGNAMAPLLAEVRARISSRNRPRRLGLRVDEGCKGRQSRIVSKIKEKFRYLGGESEGYSTDCNIFVDTIYGLIYSPAIPREYCGAHVLQYLGVELKYSGDRGALRRSRCRSTPKGACRCDKCIACRRRSPLRLYI
jgi:hypothetical protein